MQVLLSGTCTCTVHLHFSTSCFLAVLQASECEWRTLNSNWHEAPELKWVGATSVTVVLEISSIKFNYKASSHPIQRDGFMKPHDHSRWSHAVPNEQSP